MMIRNGAGIAILGLVLLASQPVHGDSTADRYTRAAEILDDSLQEALETRSQVLRVTLRPPEKDLALFARLDPAIRLISRAARARSCDWGIDMSGGFEMLMPNVGIIETCREIVAHDLRRQIAEADLQAVGDRLIVLYQMTQHVGPDVLLTCLIRGRIIKWANQALDDTLDRGMMDAIQAERILKAITSSLDARDPLHVRASLMAEAEFTVAAIEDTLVAWEGKDLTEVDERWLVDAAKQEGLDEVDITWMVKGRDAMLEGLNRYWDELLALMDDVNTKQGEDRLDLLEQRVSEGEYGPLTRMLAVGMRNYFSHTSKIRSELAERTKLLQQIVEGTFDPMSRANAAAWYGRASITAEHAGPGWWDDESSRAQVLAELAMAARASRCEFPAPEDYTQVIGEDYALQWTEPVIAWWLSSMDNFLYLRLTAADAADVAGNREAAIEHLLATGIMIRHLSEDSTLSSSIVASARCLELMNRVEAMHAIGLSVVHRRELLENLQQIPLADAFGFAKAAERTRRRLAHHLGELKERGILPAHQVPSGPDDLLYLLAWVQDLPRSTPYHDYLWAEDFTWPDAEAGTAVSVIKDKKVIAATADGTRAMEAWSVDVMLPLEPSHDLAPPGIKVLSRNASDRLRGLCRSLRQSLQDEPINE